MASNQSLKSLLLKILLLVVLASFFIISTKAEVPLYKDAIRSDSSNTHKLENTGPSPPRSHYDRRISSGSSLYLPATVESGSRYPEDGGGYYYDKERIANRQTNFDLSTFQGGTTGGTGVGTTGTTGNGGGLGGDLAGLLGAIGLPGLLGLKGLKGLIPLALLLPLVPLLPIILPALALPVLLPFLLLLLLLPVPVVVIPPAPVITTTTAAPPGMPGVTPPPIVPLCGDTMPPDCTIACSDGEAVTCTCDGVSTMPMCTPAMCTVDSTPVVCPCMDTTTATCALARYRYRRPSGREMALGLEMENRNGNVTAKVSTNSWAKRISNTIAEGAGYIKHHIINFNHPLNFENGRHYENNHTSSNPNVTHAF